MTPDVIAELTHDATAALFAIHNDLFRAGRLKTLWRSVSKKHGEAIYRNLNLSSRTKARLSELTLQVILHEEAFLAAGATPSTYEAIRLHVSAMNRVAAALFTLLEALYKATPGTDIESLRCQYEVERTKAYEASIHARAALRLDA
jgi:hypothetical protein